MEDMKYMASRMIALLALVFIVFVPIFWLIPSISFTSACALCVVSIFGGLLGASPICALILWKG